MIDRAELSRNLGIALSGMPDRKGDRLLMALDELERAVNFAILVAADTKHEHGRGQA